MAIVDITGPIYEGMWTYGLPYDPFRMEPVPPVDWAPYPTYSQNVAMSVQTGTYLETGAHMFPGMRTIDQLQPEELFLDAYIIYASEKEPGSAVAREDLGQPEIEPGSAILVCANWGRNWESPRFLEDSPHFTAEAMDYLLSFEPALIGADLPRWDSLANPQGFFERFFRQDVLLLAPVMNLEAFGRETGKLIVLPLRIRGACASPCRAIVISDQ